MKKLSLLILSVLFFAGCGTNSEDIKSSENPELLSNGMNLKELKIQGIEQRKLYESKEQIEMEGLFFDAPETLNDLRKKQIVVLKELSSLVNRPQYNWIRRQEKMHIRKWAYL